MIISEIETVERYVNGLFVTHQTPILCYHNFQHTQEVFHRATAIATHYQVPESELFLLQVAALFHDTGHLFGSISGHEERSVTIMKSYFAMEEIQWSLDTIDACIMATKMPHQPHGLLQEIICDADTYHLGTTEFLHTDDQLKHEVTLRSGKQPMNWDRETLALLKHHTYFTSYCKDLLDEGKNRNIQEVAKRCTE